MRVLVLSNTAWDINNSFGKSFDDIFSDMKDIQFANVYCKEGCPNNSINGIYYQITTRMLLQKLIKITKEKKEKQIPKEHLKKDRLSTFKKSRLRIFFWAERAIWYFGRWKTPELDQFIDDFSPEVLFMPIYASTYLNNILLYIKDRTQCPMVGYISDDNYSLKQFSLNPFYWVDRLAIRRMVGKAIRRCSVLFVITEEQKQEYRKYFDIPIYVLTKGAEFGNMPPVYNESVSEINFVFTGNVGQNRWKKLIEIANILEKAQHCSNKKLLLHIYTKTILKDSVKKKINSCNTIHFHNGVDASLISNIQRHADVLVHVESTKLKDRLDTRMSFSTKIVDYFSAGRTILAVGDANNASIAYIRRNDAGLVASTKEELEHQVNLIISNNLLLEEYAKKSWECGKRYHSKEIIQDKVLNVIRMIENK